jgi:hypothetical protein
MSELPEIRLALFCRIHSTLHTLLLLVLSYDSDLVPVIDYVY